MAEIRLVVPKWVPAGLRGDYLDMKTLYGEEKAASIVRRLKAEAAGDDGVAAAPARSQRLNSVVSLYRNGLQPKDIAAELGLTISCVDGALRRARAAGLLPRGGRA